MIEKASLVNWILVFIWDLHNLLRIPKNWVSVEISRWVKPEVELLLSVSLALAEDISVKDIRITTQIPQELKVNLIPSWPFWR